MFNCNECGKTSAAGEPAIKRVTDIRSKTYRNAIRIKEPEIDGQDGEEKRPVRRRDVRPQYLESSGHETVREVTICHKCAGVEMPVQPTPPADAAMYGSVDSIPGIRV